MLGSMLRCLITLAIAFSAGACAVEVETPDVAVDDSALTAAAKDALAIGGALEIPIAGRSLRKNFELRLDAAGHIVLAVEPVRADHPIATTLALYRDDSSKRRLLARGEDQEGRHGVRLESELTAGRYRVVVRGDSKRRGAALRLSATQLPGAEGEPSCLFGSQFSDLRSNPALVLSPDEWITSAAQLSQTYEGEQLVLAVQQSSHTDVTTVQEALSRVDQNEVRRIVIDHPTSRQQCVVYEYGAGDNSYGAIFEHSTTRLVATIHDGDLLDCTVPSSS